MATRLFGAGLNGSRRPASGRLRAGVIGDDHSFDDEALGFGWSWDDLAQGYAAGVSALQYNENRVQVTIAPGGVVGAPATVTITPRGSDLVVSNLVKTGAERTPSIEVRRLPRTSRLELRGSIPIGSEPMQLTASVENPTRFFVTALREALIDHGIDVRGAAVDIDDVTDAPIRNDRRSPGARIDRARCRHLMPVPFKFSLNLYEETLLKTMGTAAGAPTFKAGRAVVQSTLQQWGIPPGEIIQVDGSGLSRYNYVTAEALVSVLTHVDRDDKLRGPFEASLPIAGRDGMLAGQLKGTPADGNVRAKNGRDVECSNARRLREHRGR